jgi:hypothetical protein
MGTHTIDTISDLIPDTINRFQILFDRFRHELDSALERADKEYSRHMPSKGDVCEAAVRKYLSETLGSRYAVGHGHIFDSNGKLSNQQDVIIFDDHWSIRLTPRDSGEPSIIPVEAVYATIEVKKTLSSADLREAISNIQSFKSLTREQVGPDYVTPNKRISNLGYPGRIDIRNPYFSAIFAFTPGRLMNTVLEQLKRETANIPPQEWPDIVVIHNEGVLLPYCLNCNCSGDKISGIVRDGHTPTYVLDTLGKSYSLLGFHLLLMKHLHFAILEPLDFDEMYAKLAYMARSLALLDTNSTREKSA